MGQFYLVEFCHLCLVFLTMDNFGFLREYLANSDVDDADGDSIFFLTQCTLELNNQDIVDANDWEIDVDLPELSPVHNSDFGKCDDTTEKCSELQVYCPEVENVSEDEMRVVLLKNLL